MEILETLVNREIATIGALPQPGIAHRWKLIIKANGQDIEPVYIKSLQLDRLYHRNYADELTLTIGLNYADLQYKVLPYKDTLEASLTKIPMFAKNEPEVNTQKKRLTNTYKVQLTQTGSSAIAGDNPLSLSKRLADKVSIVDVTIQLINPVIDRLRKKTFGTVFRGNNGNGVNAIDAIAFTLVKFGRSDGDDTSKNVQGINIDPTFDKIIRQHILVPHNTPIVEIPELVDNQVGGTHPAQMRYYLQSQYWYLYPIFDHQRFQQNIRSLTIIKIPKYRMPGIEKTYRLANGHVILLTTRGTVHEDSTESKQLNQGNGVRYADARNAKDFYQVTGNKVIASNRNNMTEVVYEERKDESDMVMRADKLLTDKYNKEYAKLAYRSGGYIQTIWEHANIELLTPGMPVRYIFQDGETTREMYGSLNAVESMDYNTNNTVTDPRFTTMALLTCFVTNKSPLAKSTTNTSVSTTKTT